LTSFGVIVTYFPTSFKQGYAFFRTSSRGVGAGIDRVAGIVKEMQNDDICKFNEKATLYCLVLSNIELGKLTVAPSICPVGPRYTACCKQGEDPSPVQVALKQLRTGKAKWREKLND
jgi:hypothetical protein